MYHDLIRPVSKIEHSLVHLCSAASAGEMSVLFTDLIGVTIVDFLIENLVFICPLSSHWKLWWLERQSVKYSEVVLQQMQLLQLTHSQRASLGLD